MKELSYYFVSPKTGKRTGRKRTANVSNRMYARIMAEARRQAKVKETD